MKLKKHFVIFVCCLSMFYATSAKAIICEVFDLVNGIITPLPVLDNNQDMAVMVRQLKQVVKAAESGIEAITALQKNLKHALDTSLKKSIPKINVAQMKELEKGTESVVDAYKGTVQSVKGLPSVDFKDAATTEKAIEKVAAVSNAVEAVEKIEAQERKEAFIQKSIMELMARVLFYKSELNKLKQTDTSAQGTSSSEDTAGTVNISIQIKEMQAQVHVLQEKIVATEIELNNLRNLKIADPTREQINVEE